jgi:hypothetical protein
MERLTEADFLWGSYLAQVYEGVAARLLVVSLDKRHNVVSQNHGEASRKLCPFDGRFEDADQLLDPFLISS